MLLFFHKKIPFRVNATALIFWIELKVFVLYVSASAMLFQKHRRELQLCPKGCLKGCAPCLTLQSPGGLLKPTRKAMDKYMIFLYISPSPLLGRKFNISSKNSNIDKLINVQSFLFKLVSMCINFYEINSTGFCQKIRIFLIVILKDPLQ